MRGKRSLNVGSTNLKTCILLLTVFPPIDQVTFCQTHESTDFLWNFFAYRWLAQVLGNDTMRGLLVLAVNSR
jgi:hypothetical protein